MAITLTIVLTVPGDCDCSPHSCHFAQVDLSFLFYFIEQADATANKERKRRKITKRQHLKKVSFILYNKEFVGALSTFKSTNLLV